ncbi:unnamed protein product, partial [Mesorhabditis belari]|uniref:Uncharacterized protein n=1 Tax=Mesorhabditis belari TaxID=2138241 RepID=A0AAF3ET92_9BILA
MAANLQSTDFRETFIEKLQRENIGEYRSIRLDEWKEGDKVHRNWTYINCSPLEGSGLVNASSTKRAQSAQSLMKTGDRSDPPSPVVRKRKQERILEEEQFEINEELKRQKERLSKEDEREKRKQEQTLKQEELEIQKEVKDQMGRLEKTMKGGDALDRKQERILKQEQLEIDADLKRQKERLSKELLKEGITSKPRNLKELSPRQLQGQSTGRQEFKQKVNAVEHITNLVNEDPEARRLWMDMVNNVRDATNNLRYCQKNIGEKRLPGVNEGWEQMEEICLAVDQLTHVVIRKK